MNAQTENQKKQATILQMVEIDQNRFAIEVIDGEVRANLTQMAKPYGTTPKDWLRTDESSRYLDALSSRRKCLLTDLVRVKNGGRNEEKGTWAYDHNVVVEFARWLNPMFAIQVNEMVWKLINGQAQIVSSEPAKQIFDFFNSFGQQSDEKKKIDSLPHKRNHNRITPARMVNILSDVAKIDDKELRLSLIQKLGV